MNDDTMAPWSVLDEELIADFSPDQLRAIVGMIELNNALALLAYHTRLLILRSWAVTR